MSSEHRLPYAKRLSREEVAPSPTPFVVTKGFSLSSLFFALSFFLFALSACGSSPPQPLIFGDPVWTDGEISLYRVTNREDRIVGTAAFQVKQAAAG